MRTNLDREFGDRLVDLHDGHAGLRGGLSCDVRETPGEEAQLDFVASDETVDRYNEVIRADSWNLDNYRKNPVVVDSHDYSSVSKILGNSTAVAVVGGKLLNRVRFALDNPLGRIAYGMARSGFIKSESVGFIPREWEDGGIGGPSRVYTHVELIEISLVTVPANPAATIGAAVKSGAVSRSDIRDLVDMLDDFTDPRSSAWRRFRPESAASDVIRSVDRLLENLRPRFW